MSDEDMEDLLNTLAPGRKGKENRKRKHNTEDADEDEPNFKYEGELTHYNP